MSETVLKEQLIVSLKGRGAHTPHAALLARIPAGKAALVPPGMTHSAFQLVEHMRACMDDILNYCRRADYAHPASMDDFWVANPAEVSEEAWEKARAAFFRSLNEMIELVGAEETRLHERVPGAGPDGPADHTFFREAVIIVDHNSYHCGQLAVLAHVIESG